MQDVSLNQLTTLKFAHKMFDLPINAKKLKFLEISEISLDSRHFEKLNSYLCAVKTNNIETFKLTRCKIGRNFWSFDEFGDEYTRIIQELIPPMISKLSKLRHFLLHGCNFEKRKTFSTFLTNFKNVTEDNVVNFNKNLTHLQLGYISNNHLNLNLKEYLSLNLYNLKSLKLLFRGHSNDNGNSSSSISNIKNGEYDFLDSIIMCLLLSKTSKNRIINYNGDDKNGHAGSSTLNLASCNLEELSFDTLNFGLCEHCFKILMTINFSGINNKLDVYMVDVKFETIQDFLSLANKMDQFCQYLSVRDENTKINVHFSCIIENVRIRLEHTQYDIYSEMEKRIVEYFDKWQKLGFCLKMHLKMEGKSNNFECELKKWKTSDDVVTISCDPKQRRYVFDVKSTVDKCYNPDKLYIISKAQKGNNRAFQMLFDWTC